MMRLPVMVDPVNEIMSTSGDTVSSSPTRWSAEVTTLTTPGGMSVFSAIRRPSRVAFQGVSGAGLTITVLPAGQDGPQLVQRHLERVVPRHDGTDDADRLFPDGAAALDAHHVPIGQSAVPGKLVDHLGRPPQRLLEWPVQLRRVGHHARGSHLGDELLAVRLPFGLERLLQLLEAALPQRAVGRPVGLARRPPGPRRSRAACPAAEASATSPNTSSVAGLMFSKRFPEAALDELASDEHARLTGGGR